MYWTGRNSYLYVLTEHFSNLEPRSLEIDERYVVPKRRSTDFMVLNLRKAWAEWGLRSPLCYVVSVPRGFHAEIKKEREA